MSDLVIVTRGLPDGWLQGLSDYETVVGPPDAPGWRDELRARLPEATAILCMLTEPVDADVLAAAPRLRVVSNMAVGVDNIDVAACTRRGIPVGHTPGVLTDATADLTMTLLLASARRIATAAADVHAGRWTTWSPTGWLGADLAGARLGIVGLGQIGAAVARRARAFGLEIAYHSRTARPDLERSLRLIPVTLDELWSTSDFVSVHVPLAADTHHLVDAAALRKFKPTAHLVNTARGPIVDPIALAEALHAGRLAGAALDVTVPEPLPPDDPLLRAPNLLVLPHIGSATAGTRRKMAQLAVANVRAGLRGEPLPHCVNASAL